MYIIYGHKISSQLIFDVYHIAADTYWPLRPRIASLASSLFWKTTKAKQGLLLVFQTSTRGPNFSNVFSKSLVLQLTGRSLTCTRTLSPRSALALRLLRRLELWLRRRLRLRLRLLFLLLDESRLLPIPAKHTASSLQRTFCTISRRDNV